MAFSWLTMFFFNCESTGFRILFSALSKEKLSSINLLLILSSKVEQQQTFIEKYFQEIHFTSQYLAANSETIFFHCITKHPTYLGGMGSSLSIRDSSRKQGLSGSRSQASPWAYHDLTAVTQQEISGIFHSYQYVFLLAVPP